MIFLLGGLNFKVVVGGLFVMRFIYRSWIGIMFFGILSVVVKNIDVILLMLEEIMYFFYLLLYS